MAKNAVKSGGSDCRVVLLQWMHRGIVLLSKDDQIISLAPSSRDLIPRIDRRRVREVDIRFPDILLVKHINAQVFFTSEKSLSIRFYMPKN